MPTPIVIRDNVRHRTNIAIGLGEAVRLARAAAGRPLALELQIKGRDVRTGAVATTVLSVGEILSPPPPTGGPVWSIPRPPDG